MTESKLFAYGDRENSFFFPQIIFLSDLQGEEGLQRENFEGAWSKQ